MNWKDLVLLNDRMSTKKLARKEFRFSKCLEMG